MNVSRHLSVVPVKVTVKRPDAPTFVPFGCGTSWPMFSAALNLTGRGVVAEASVAAIRATTPTSAAAAIAVRSLGIFASFQSLARKEMPRAGKNTPGRL